MTNDWERTAEVTLVNGRVLKVRATPPLLGLKAMAIVAMPDPPIVEVPSQVPGGTPTKFSQDEDPEYLRARRDAITKRYEILIELQWSYGLPGIVAPEDDVWKADIEVYLPDIEWRKGPHGRKLDYIEYVVLSNAEDQKRIRDAIDSISSITVSEQLAQVAEESFRS